MRPGKTKGSRASAMAKHRDGVRDLAARLLSAGYAQFEDDGREGESLPPFSFMVSERYRMNGKSGILRDLVLRTDGRPVDVKAYIYADATSHTSILRIAAYVMAYTIRRPRGVYLNLVTGDSNTMLSDIMAAQTGRLNLWEPSGIRLLDDTLDQLRAYLQQRRPR